MASPAALIAALARAGALRQRNQIMAASMLGRGISDAGAGIGRGFRDQWMSDQADQRRTEDREAQYARDVRRNAFQRQMQGDALGQQRVMAEQRSLDADRRQQRQIDASKEMQGQSLKQRQREGLLDFFSGLADTAERGVSGFFDRRQDAKEFESREKSRALDRDMRGKQLSIMEAAEARKKEQSERKAKLDRDRLEGIREKARLLAESKNDSERTDRARALIADRNSTERTLSTVNRMIQQAQDSFGTPSPEIIEQRERLIRYIEEIDRHVGGAQKLLGSEPQAQPQSGSLFGPKTDSEFTKYTGAIQRQIVPALQAGQITPAQARDAVRQMLEEKTGLKGKHLDKRLGDLGSEDYYKRLAGK